MIALLLSLAAAPALSQPSRAPAAIAQQADQETWRIDQLRLPRDTDPKILQALEPDHSLDAVMTHLTKLGVTFRRAHVTIYPDGLAPQLRDALLALPKGEPFVLPEPDFVSVSVLVSRHIPNSVVLLPSTSTREA